jgi:hypothetical protein
MNTVKCITIALFVGALAGCETIPKAEIQTTQAVSATTPAPTEQLGLRSEIVSHLDNATEIAKAGNDPQGAQCWAAAKVWVATLPIPQDAPQAEIQLPAATGPAGVYEIARIRAKAAEDRIASVKAKIAALRALVDAGIPDSVVTACAVVSYERRALSAKILNLIGLGALNVGF